MQYAIDDFELRSSYLIRQSPGPPRRALCERRLEWLDRALRESDRPTLIAQHIRLLQPGSRDGSHGAANPEAEAEVIARHPHVQCIISGHYHRTIQTRFAGTVASVCPSTGHQLALDLTPGADIRFTFEPPAFQLHLWNGEGVVTHTALVDDFPTWGSRDG